MNNLMIPIEDQSQQDLEYMDAAIQMAEEASSSSEIPVGCVFVHPSKGIIAKGRNRTNERKNATLHAEFDALSQLLPNRSTTTSLTSNDDPRREIWTTPLREVVLYVTVEPCIMCASALRQVGVEKVIYGCGNDRFGGTGGVQSIHSDERLLYSPTYQALGNYRREEAIMLLRRFYLTENTAAPKPKNKKNRVLKEEIEQVNVVQTLPSSSTHAETNSKETIMEETGRIP